LRAEISEPKLYGTMLGVVTATNGGIAGIDALAGGFLAGSYGFRSVFWVIAIVATLATISVWIWARESRPSQGTRMDWIGVATLSAAVGAFLIALDEAAKLAAANWVFVGVLILVAVAAFVAFWQVETVRKNPLISIRDLTKRSTWALLLTTLLTMTGVFATVNGVVIDFAQNTHSGFGLAAGVASLALLTPYALIGWLVGPLAGRYSPILGYGRVLRIGLVGSIIAIVGMMFIGLHSLPAMIAATVLIGVTYAGTTNIVLNGLGIVLSPQDNPGILPGLNAGVFNLGAALSFVVLPAVQLIGSPAGSSSSTGYFSAILVGLIITSAALAVSFLIPRPVAAEAKDETR
jgi:MFS family permease